MRALALPRPPLAVYVPPPRLGQSPSCFAVCDPASCRALAPSHRRAAQRVIYSYIAQWYCASMPTSVLVSGFSTALFFGGAPSFR